MEAQDKAIIPLREGGLKNLVVLGTFWTLLGHVFNQLIRFGNNLILTRLLFPEAFGVMALFHLLMTGLEMFSDMGINFSIIQSERGGDSRFVNTAWTVQILRGVLLWGGMVLIAVPAANYFEVPILRQIIPMAGLTALINGFNTSRWALLNRSLQLRFLTVIELISQVIGVIGTLILAWLYRSVWALVYGALFSCFIKVLIGHLSIPGVRHRFELDKSSLREIISFGKWILISTTLTFLFSSMDRLFLGKVLSIEWLGIYSIAYFISQTGFSAVQRISGKVLLPVYSQFVRDGLDSQLCKLKRIRQGLLLLVLPPVCVLTLWGRHIIAFFYDSRYQEAGWMLELLSLHVLVAVITSTISPILLADGQSKNHSFLVFVKVVFLTLGIGIGWSIAGLKGMILGIFFAHVITYVFVSIAVKRYRLWMPSVDVPALLGCFLVILLSGKIRVWMNI